MLDLDKVLRHYLYCALWSSNDDNDKPLDATYGISDIAQEAIEQSKKDCGLFLERAGDLLGAASDHLTETYSNHSEWDGPEFWIGCDIWLTRNGHGSGFWDRDFPGELGDQLTLIASSLGEVYMYVGDDGKIYV